MPNIWTHILFCEEIADSLQKNTPYIQQEVYMNLGAQGPDPFFYHNFWPWKKESDVNKIGTVLHTEKCGEFLIDLICQATLASSEVQAYVFGFVTHHILDRNAHPYIHYKAGYDGHNHQRLEVIIDTLMTEKLRHLKTWKAPVYKEIDAGNRMDQTVADFLDNTIRKHYKQSTAGIPEKYIQHSYRDMKLALRILYDPNGWKNSLFPSLVSAFSHRPVETDIDYLNEGNDTWFHPATKEASQESFLQLYDKARNEGIEIMNEVLSYWKEPAQSKEAKLTALIDNISYDTGKPLSSKLRNKHSNPIV
ncbi:zinc dependent phospholipase C family protein [Sediminibacillus albus]|uniref:Zinc dependent phospholipase C n=1 Tax=Sediminibacillus albus TaxID=407036 RepID=A0A1G8XHW7_9BACI|nr:zinc dependent phospholipase C family protein [Sediminibacillus albus]SDJ89370.1 Zinc dependent phospholipase C [Sediminibacillus albus]